MTRAVPPRACGEEREAVRPRCPRCGAGDLFSIEVARPAGATRQGTYCAGLYDRDRRRFVRRSCGYTGLPPDDALPARPGIV